MNAYMPLPSVTVMLLEAPLATDTDYIGLTAPGHVDLAAGFLINPDAEALVTAVRTRLAHLPLITGSVAHRRDPLPQVGVVGVRLVPDTLLANAVHDTLTAFADHGVTPPSIYALESGYWRDLDHSLARIYRVGETVELAHVAVVIGPSHEDDWEPYVAGAWSLEPAS